MKVKSLLFGRRTGRTFGGRKARVYVYIVRVGVGHECPFETIVHKEIVGQMHNARCTRIYLGGMVTMPEWKL